MEISEKWESLNFILLEKFFARTSWSNSLEIMISLVCFCLLLFATLFIHFFSFFIDFPSAFKSHCFVGWCSEIIIHLCAISMFVCIFYHDFRLCTFCAVEGWGAKTIFDHLLEFAGICSNCPVKNTLFPTIDLFLFRFIEVAKFSFFKYFLTVYGQWKSRCIWLKKTNLTMTFCITIDK